MNFYNLNIIQKINYIFLCLQISIAVIGIIGNTLNIVVYMRKRFKNISFSFYNKVLAFVDIIVLLHSSRHWAASMLDANIDTVAPFLCSSMEYLSVVATFTSLYLLMFISIDRLITIAYPNRFNVIKKKWFQGNC